MKRKLIALSVLCVLTTEASHANEFFDNLKAKAEQAKTFIKKKIEDSKTSNVEFESTEDEWENEEEYTNAPRARVIEEDQIAAEKEEDNEETRRSRALNEKIKEYENSSMVNHTLEYMNQNVEPNSIGLCATYVRKGLMESGLIKVHPQIAYARNYTPYFKKQGWTDLLKVSKTVQNDIRTSPAGCVVVYEGINPRNSVYGHIGHIEVRTKKDGKNGFISDFYSDYPVTGLVCAEPGRTVKKLKTYIARKDSPYYSRGQKVELMIDVTECRRYTKRGAVQSDAWSNHRASSFSCKLN